MDLIQFPFVTNQRISFTICHSPIGCPGSCQECPSIPYRFWNATNSRGEHPGTRDWSVHGAPGTRARNKGIRAAQRPHQQIARAFCYTDLPDCLPISPHEAKRLTQAIPSPNRAKGLNTNIGFVRQQSFLTCKQEFARFSFMSFFCSFCFLSCR